MAAILHGPLGAGNLLQSPPQVDSACLIALWITPGNRLVQDIVDLEDPRTISVAFEFFPVSGGKTLSGDPEHLTGCEVEQDGPRRGQFIQMIYRSAGLYLTADSLKVVGQSRCNGSRPATGQRPPAGVSCSTKDQSECRGQRLFKGLDTVCSHSGKQCACTFASESVAGESCRGLQGFQAERCHPKWISRKAERCKNISGKVAPAISKRLVELFVTFIIFVKLPLHIGKRAVL